MTPLLHAPSQPVLVVDDDRDMRAYLVGCLRAVGLERTAEAADGVAALRLTQEVPFGLIITDIVMPDMDGETLCETLKRDPATADVPLLIVSSVTPSPDACADGYLARPFNARSLRHQLEQVLSPASA